MPGAGRITTRRRLLMVCAALSCLSVAAADDDRPVLVVPRLEEPPRLEDFLEMAPTPELEGKMSRIGGFIQREPEDGKPASQHTDVYLGYDDEALYVVFVAFDEEPDRIRAQMNRRENIRGEDLVEVMLDSFGDRQRAYTFIVTPAGVQWDAIWTEGQGFDMSWDTVWQSEVERNERGYLVWFAIPFESLRFPEDAGNDWGVIFLREIPRANENAFWPHVSARIEGRLNQGATLRGLSGISPGRNMQVIPYATARNFEVLDQEEAAFDDDSFDGDAGVDAKFVFRDSLALDLTLNPDFSQVESDEAQVTVNRRFEVFFPERRPFFLENADFFRTPYNLLFTRRIADPRTGARLTGKVGSWALGALVIDDEAPGDQAEPGEPGHGERAWSGVVRVRRDLPRQSNIGLIYTDREIDEGYNRVGGVDGRFRLDKTWDLRFQAVTSSTRTLDGEELSGPAYDLTFNRAGRRFNTHIHYLDIARDFRTELGFVPRVDIREFHHSTGYTFWPEGAKLISWGPQVFMTRVEDQEGLRLDEFVEPSIEWEFPRQTELQLFGRWGRERLRPEDFETLAAPEDFSIRSSGLKVGSRFSRTFGFSGRVQWGRTINLVPPEGQPPSEADELSATLDFTLRPGRRLVIDTAYLRTELDDKNGQGNIFANEILRTRCNWQFTTELSLRMILRYDRTRANPQLSSLDEETENLNADLLVTYLVNPWTALYVGYNTNYQNLELEEAPGGSQVVRTEDDLSNDAKQLFVKLSYLFRF